MLLSSVKRRVTGQPRKTGKGRGANKPAADREDSVEASRSEPKRGFSKIGGVLGGALGVLGGVAAGTIGGILGAAVALPAAVGVAFGVGFGAYTLVQKFAPNSAPLDEAAGPAGGYIGTLGALGAAAAGGPVGAVVIGAGGLLLGAAIGGRLLGGVPNSKPAG